MKMERKRNIGLDTLSGFFICFMVLMHWQGNCSWANSLFNALLPVSHFFMAWFFYKSGMVFKKKDTAKDTIIKSSNRLLLPFIFSSVVGYFIWGLMLLFDHNLHFNYISNIPKELFWNGCLMGNGPVWFLLSLFCIQLCFSFIGKSRDSVVIMTTAFAIIAFTLHLLDIKLPQYIGNICLGGFFFGIGNLTGLKFTPKKPIVLLGFAIFIITEIFIPSRVSVVGNNVVNGYYIIWIIAALCGIIFYNYLATEFIKKRNVFSFLGEHTMPILLWHMPFYNLIQLIFS